MAFTFIKKWFSKTSVFETLARWQDSPLRNGTFPRRRLTRGRTWARDIRLGLELLEAREVPAAFPVVSLGVDPTPFIGAQGVPMSITFTNPSPAATTPGFGPWVYAILPATGIDGNDGISFVPGSAKFFGAGIAETLVPVTGTGVVTGPSYARAANGSPFTLSGLTSGDQVVFFQLPYISYSIDQPGGTITFNTNVSNLADVAKPLTVKAGGGFGLGNDALDNAGTDPALLAAQVTATETPQLFIVDKVFSGPEQETATGPNYVRTYTLNVRVAPGQTLTPFQLTDALAPGMQFIPGSGTSPTGTFTNTAGTTATAVQPGGKVVANFSSITGDTGGGSTASVDASFTFSFFVPRVDSTSTVILPASTGDFKQETDTVTGTGAWPPIDSRDPSGPVTSNPVTDTFTAKSVAIQKGVAVIGGNGLPQQNALLEYTINFQVSDYFAFDTFDIPDLLPDGTRFLSSFTPVLTVKNPSGVGVTNINMSAANYIVGGNRTGSFVASDYNADGTQTIRFDVSKELGGGALGRLIGGWIPAGGTTGPLPDPSAFGNNPLVPRGPAEGTITFRATVQNMYDVTPSNTNVKQGDTLVNVVPTDPADTRLTDLPGLTRPGGGVLSASNLSPTGNVKADDTSATVKIRTGVITKEIYAINGVVGGPYSNPVLQDGDTVTYRLTYTLPTSSAQNFTLTDYLPLPVFDATSITTANFTTPQVAAPAVGTATFGPGVTATPTLVNYGQGAIAGQADPTISTNAVANTVVFTFPANLQDPSQRTSFVDILFTVQIHDEPLADGYPLTNQANAREGNTQDVPTPSDQIIPVTLGRPVLNVTKGVVATNGVTTTFTPGTVGPVAFTTGAATSFAGGITSNNLAATPINSNLSGIDAGDLATFAVVVENKGTGPHGAFDVVINDTRPAGLSDPTTGLGLNLQFRDGTGSSANYQFFSTVTGLSITGNAAAIEAAFFKTDGGTGLRISGTGPTAAAALANGISTNGGVIDQFNPTSGRNILVITYDLRVDDTTNASPANANVTLTNTGTVTSYYAEPFVPGPGGSKDYAPTNNPTFKLTDPAQVTIENPKIVKTFVSTSFTDSLAPTFNTNAQAVIGEEITYQVVVTYPEGITPGAKIVDLLDNGLQFVSLDSVTASAGLTLNAIALGGPSANVTLSGAPNTGQTITFNTGAVTNTGTDNAARTLTLVYRVRVADVANSQQGNNKNNQADVTFTGKTTTIRGSATNVQILEPIVTTVKDVTVNGVLNGTGDAGDPVSYTITLSNPAQTVTPGGNFTTVAYNVALSDTLPDHGANDDVLFSSTIGYGGTGRYSAADFTIIGGVLQTVSPLPDLRPGETITLTVTGVIKSTVVTGQTVPNTATTTFTSLPTGNPTEAFERTGAGGVDDYKTQDPGDFVIATPNPNKVIVLTSEASTAINSPALADVAIGEVVRYHLSVQIPQTAGLANFRLSDVMPAGLQFLNDAGATKVALVSSGGAGLTATLIPVGGQFNGTVASVTPTFAFPAGLITGGTGPGGTFLEGDDPVFSFGTVTNTNSSMTTDEFVVLEFNALVLNTAANVVGQTRVNTFTVGFNGNTSAPSGAATVTIVEPKVDVVKTAVDLDTGTTTGDAGDTVEYTITLTNSGNATAFNTVFGDTLPPDLGSPTIFSVSGSSLGIGDFSISAGGVISTNNAPTGFTIPSTPGNNTVVIVVRGVLKSSVTPTQSILNSADVTYTSLPGTNGTTGNTTGSDTPGSPGTPTGERTGDSLIAPDNYFDSDAATVDVPNGSVVKALDSTSLGDTAGANVAIGERVTYALTVTLPEGTTPTLTLTDILPAGVTVDMSSIALDTTGFNGSVALGSESLASNTLTITFAPGTTVTGDNNTANNSFVVRYTVTVDNVPGNVGVLPTQTNLTNAVTMKAGTAPPVTAPTPVTTPVVEPVLQIDKTVTSLDTSIDAGTSIDYQLVVSHVPNASTGPAYNLVITDALLPIGMTLDTSSIVVTPSDPTAVVGAITFDANGVHITVDKLLPGDTITVTYSATLNGPAASGTVPLPGSTVTNTATTTYNTIPTPGGGRPEGPISDTAQITVNSYSISGEIYYDANDDGTRQPATEPLILVSTAVRLIGRDSENNLVDMTLTGITSGQYSFTGLRPGNYRVLEVATPTGYLDGIDSVGTQFGGTGAAPAVVGKTDVSGGVGVVGGLISSIVIPLDAAQDGVANVGTDYDFGELLPASIGDFVWLDANNNGQQDSVEPGINGVTVTLNGTDDEGTVGPVTTTTATVGLVLGSYSFPNLRPGTYTVTFGDSDGTTTYIRTVQGAGTPATDSDADVATGDTAPITLVTGQNNPDIDEGLFLQADLSITKDDGVLTYTAGLSTTYTIVVKNNGPSSATNVKIDDAFDFTKFASVKWTVTGSTGGATGFTTTLNNTTDIHDVVDMPNGSTITYTVTGLIRSDSLTTLSNTATVTPAFGTVDLDLTNNADTDDDTPNPVADLKITKTDGVSSYKRNNPLTYTIVVTNSGPSDVQAATVTDNFPAFFTGVTWSVTSETGGATSSFAVGVNQFGNILDTVYMPSGSTITYTATGIVAPNATGKLVNTATVSIPSGDLTPLNNTATDSDNPPGGAPGSIAGLVYQDTNNDGIRQASEVGIAGATVTLLNGSTVVGTTTTAADGSYIFTGLTAGTYRVNETQPVGYTDGKDQVGNVGGSLVPPDSIVSIPIGSGTVATGYNFGELGSGVGVSGKVFFDANKDGNLQGTESGIVGIPITLKNAAGVVVATTLTDPNGNYSFPSVAPGTYTITETQPTGYGNPPSGPFAPNTRTITVVSTPIVEQNFGDTLASLSGVVYQDPNNDGIKQASEPGIGGVTVSLFNATTGAIMATTTTAVDGTYSFSGLGGGKYRVVETQPAAFTDGKDAVGSSGGTLVPTDTIDAVTITAGSVATGYNFGELVSGTGISGKVFLDADKDGNLDAGETGIPVVTVTLTNSSGVVVGKTTTDANGNYSFPNVATGDYTITETQPASYGNPPSGPFAPDTRTVTLVAGGSSTNQNFGDTLGGLSGLVYQDLNNDGIRQAAEPPIPGATVTLFNGTTTVGTTTTAADGTYNFTSLPAGSYSVVETQPTAFTDGKDTVGSVGGTLQSPDTIKAIALPAGVLATGYNFGEVFQGISGKVFLDADKDGNLDAGETGIPVVTVTLTNSSGVVVGKTTTDANGNYSFPNVATGDYTITETQPASYGNPPSGPFAPDKRTVTLAPGGSSTDQNFGDTLGGLSGLVYQDLNNDGIRQAAEPPIPGATVTLFNGTTTVGTAITAADGTYNFSGLPAGTNYRVVETQPAGFTDGKDTAGTGGGTLAPTDTIGAITIGPGVLVGGYNFGELASATNKLSGTVYLDENQDSVYQPGSDKPLPGIPVTLKNASGVVVAVTTTAADGTYSFSNLPAGKYTLTETQPTSYGSSEIPLNIRTVTMPASGNVANQNFGDTLGNISGKVYRDYNLNGVFDTMAANPDTGIPGVAVSLKNSAGVVVMTTVTDTNGNYKFNDIVPGKYTVSETQPPRPTTLTNGFYDGADNLGTLSGTAGPKNSLGFVMGIDATTKVSQNARSYNFGELPPADPNGFVFLDNNRNGIRDAGDQGIANVAITISGTAFAGTQFARPIVGADVPGGSLTVFTNANGFYQFNPIPPGLYAIREAQPAGFLDGQEQNGDPSGPLPTIGNDLFTNMLLNPFPVRGPFNFGELLPVGGLDPSKRDLLGSAI